MTERNVEQWGHFTVVSGMKVFEPRVRCSPESRKHPCSDCHFCQVCSDARCHACRGGRSGRPEGNEKKLSVEEQLRLYDEINCGDMS